VPVDRINYIAAIGDSWKQQTLLNVVRLRYADTPSFMDLSSVIASYAFVSQVGASVGVNLNVPSGTTITPGGVVGVSGNVGYVDRPTMSYTPLSGDKFTKSLLRPIPPAAIFSLIAAGYPADFLLQVTVRAMNGVYNRSNSGGAVRPADPEFYALLDALRRIQLSEAFSLRVANEAADSTRLSILLGARTPEIQADIDFVLRTLNLPEVNELELSAGAVPRTKTELAVLSRSMLEILHELAANIEVPNEHVAEGRTFPNIDPGANAQSRDLPLVRIYSGTSAPPNAYAAVSYQNAWYWIDDRDYASKNAFTFLLLFFALAETGVQAQAPLLTLPVQ
jgi:hypothetical protein